LIVVGFGVFTVVGFGVLTNVGRGVFSPFVGFGVTLLVGRGVFGGCQTVGFGVFGGFVVTVLVGFGVLIGFVGFGVIDFVGFGVFGGLVVFGGDQTVGRGVFGGFVGRGVGSGLPLPHPASRSISTDNKLRALFASCISHAFTSSKYSISSVATQYPTFSHAVHLQVAMPFTTRSFKHAFSCSTAFIYLFITSSHTEYALDIALFAVQQNSFGSLS